MTVYKAHNRYFIAVSNGVREIPFAVILEWRKQGDDVVIIEEVGLYE
jgi:hypothetical protein